MVKRYEELTFVDDFMQLFRAKQNFIIRLEMLAFLRLVLKFYLADTPHRRNAKHFGGWL